MKRITFFISIILIFSSIGLQFTLAQVVDIPDRNLRAAIEEALGKASGDIITVAEMGTLQFLNASNANIGDLTGLEYAVPQLLPLDPEDPWGEVDFFPGLTLLTLSNNSISDITPLSGLLGLEELNLSNNAISDITPLAGLTNLDELYLSNNAISDITPLAGLTDLEELYLSNNAISDILPLVLLTKVLDDYDSLNYLFVQGNPLNDTSINTHIPFLLSRGTGLLSRTKLFLPAIAPAAVGEAFTLDLIVKDVYDLAGWQLDLAFNPAVLKAISVSEGGFLSSDGGNTFFQAGDINNAAGAITGVSGAFIGTGGVSGTGTLLSIDFEIQAAGQGSLQLSEDRLGASNGNQIHYDIVIHPVIVESTYDLNGDGKVDVLDLMLVAQNLGQANPQVDVNGDGTVNVFDLIAVAQHSDSIPNAPTGLAYDWATLHSTMIQKWIDMAHAANDGSLVFRIGIANLERLLASLLPDETVLLPNYPNPFNPETWMPYHLSNSAEVQLTIHDAKGAVVRQLSLGYQQVGYYTDRTKAAYWDGRNESGEAVGSGVYFYQLQADDFSATRKMLILK